VLALAHPLGNFTINHYAGIRVELHRVILDVVLDRAEIPTFQEKLRIDTDGDGSVSDEEAEAERVRACPAFAPSLSLTVAGRPIALEPVAAGLSFPPGAAGLQTMRLVCTYIAELPGPLAAGTPIVFADPSYADRLGWHEITAEGSDVTITGSGIRATSVSNRLTAYPTDMLKKPLDERSVSLVASPGGPELAPFSVPDASPLPGAAPLDPAAAHGPDDGGAPGRAGGSSDIVPAGAPLPAQREAPQSTVASGAVPGGVGGEISGLLEVRDLTPLVLLGSFVAAMALGAGHALTPGHGKTLMGAYLVGTRGTPVHAVALGLSVTVSHTLGIVVLAAVVVALRGVLPPETFNRWAPIASGILVLGIGTWLLAGQLRARRVRPAPVDHGQAHHGPHIHDGIDHDHANDGTELAADRSHTHDGVTHGHLPADGSRLTWRSLFVLGLAGGIIPSTNALIILLATIATGRAAYGLVLVVAFGLGMAVVLGGVGLGLVLARDRLDGLPSSSRLGRLAPYAPLMAGFVVFGLGLYLTSQAIGVAPTL
jgi:nickel/cobalt transporter (NicO) family protein